MGITFILFETFLWKQQQVQCGIWVREHDVPAGNLEALQGLSSSTLGGLQLQKNL